MENVNNELNEHTTIHNTTNLEPKTIIKKSNTITELAKSLSKFQGEVNNPANTASNPFYKSKYAPLNEVLNTVRPILSKYGLSVIQSAKTEGSDAIITTMLLHESGEWIEFESLSLKSSKNDAQGIGSAITYGRRYALSTALGISSEDDDDGNAAIDGKNTKTNKATKTAPRKNIELEKAIAEIDKLAKEKAKANRDEVMKAITSHHTNANYNSITDIEVAKKVQEELQNI